MALGGIDVYECQRGFVRATGVPLWPWMIFEWQSGALVCWIKETRWGLTESKTSRQ
jgi:hypothetical protein